MRVQQKTLLFHKGPGFRYCTYVRHKKHFHPVNLLFSFMGMNSLRGKHQYLRDEKLTTRIRRGKGTAGLLISNCSVSVRLVGWNFWNDWRQFDLWTDKSLAIRNEIKKSGKDRKRKTTLHGWSDDMGQTDVAASIDCPRSGQFSDLETSHARQFQLLDRTY